MMTLSSVPAIDFWNTTGTKPENAGHRQDEPAPCAKRNVGLAMCKKTPRRACSQEAAWARTAPRLHAATH